MREEKTQLYKLSKRGAVLSFLVIAREIEDGAVLITRKGQAGGTEQEDIEPQYPKSVGKANETTPWAQSIIMYNSKISKLGDKGYKRVPLINPTVRGIYDYLLPLDGTDINGRYLPQLAQKDVSKITYSGDLQKKFDGVRSHHDPKGSMPWRSRRGKEFSHIGHLTPQIPHLPRGWELDGELYCHGRSLQQIVSMIKREQEANLQIGYRNYDIMGTGMPWKYRKVELRKIWEDSGPQIKAVLSYPVHSHEQMIELFLRFKKQGYEGAIWRDPEGFYEYNTRSWGMIKVKNYEEEEFEIVDVEEATGRDAGTAIFICITKDGQEFNCRPMGTREVRREYLDDFDEKCLGKMLTVRFQNYTDKGIPFHHRGVIIRDYE